LKKNYKTYTTATTATTAIDTIATGKIISFIKRRLILKNK
jgi:hypothetical protein